MLTIKTFTVNALQENCYVVSDASSECVIIDCGAETPDERQAVVDYIRSHQLRPVHLLATHGHLDHNYGIEALWQAFNLPLKLHRLDERLIRGLSEQGRAFFGVAVDIQPHIGGFLSDGDTVTFGTHTLRCIFTPGHTPGGLCYHCPEENVLFAGDTLFRLSIGRADLPGGSMFQIINSLRHLSQLPDSTRVLTGHGPETTIGYELAHNPYLDR